jgi:hypothetical protein
MTAMIAPMTMRRWGKITMMTLNRTQKEIINYLIAENEETYSFEYLTENGYTRRIYHGLKGRQAVPDQYDRVWRKYSDFYNRVVRKLRFPNNFHLKNDKKRGFY